MARHPRTEDRLSDRIMTIGVALMIAAFWLLTLASPCAAQSNDLVGSEWVYSFQEELLGVVEYTGNWTYSCVRIVDSPLGDTQQKVAEYHSTLVISYDRSSGSAPSGYSWTLILSEDQYYDIETSELIGSISNEHIEERHGSGNNISTYSYDERNETVCTPPGGSGTEPAAIAPGDTWTKAYTKVSNVSGYEDGVYFAKEFTWTETLEFTYIGSETLSVPAGIFSCNKYEIAFSDGETETAWWAPDISGYAKIEDAYGSNDVLTYELKSYRLESGSGGGTVEMGPDWFIASFFTFVAVTVVAAAYASTIVKGKKKPSEEKFNENRLEELEVDYLIHDGTRLHIRPLKATDEQAWLDFVNNLSPDSSYHRFFEVRKGFSHRDIGHYLEIDSKKRMAIVAAIPGAGGRIVAIARYERIPDMKIGEFAIVVSDDFQDKGVGTYLLSRLSLFARTHGIEEFVAEILPDNEHMMDLFRKSGLRMESKLESGTRLVRLFLDGS